MNYTEVTRIITERVLNNNTGELEPKTFREVKQTKQVKGGFSMVYKSYDDVLKECVTSNLDLKIILAIREMFTYARIEVVISALDLSKQLKTSKQKVTTVITKLVENRLLKRVARGTYRLNPFMYLPFRSDASTLQAEWKTCGVHTD